MERSWERRRRGCREVLGRGEYVVSRGGRRVRLGCLVLVVGREVLGGEMVGCGDYSDGDDDGCGCGAEGWCLRERRDGMF